MRDDPKLIVGLGNPGKEYETMRHSIGRRVVIELAASFGEGGWTQKSDLASDIKSGNNVMLVLPNTFMNDSGKVVGRVTKFYKIKSVNILAVHDDSDIPFGKIKLSFGSRSAGHKGVESVIKALGTKDFWRLRIGIQPTVSNVPLQAGKHVRADKLVLQPFMPAEKRKLGDVVEAAVGTLKAWIANDG